MTSSKRPVTKLIVPLAGVGTRFAPFSSVYPKEMAHLVDKPVLQYIVQEAYLSGITEIIFVINPQKDSIRDYFSAAYQRSYQQKTFPYTKDIPKALTELNVLVKKMKFHFITRDATRGDGHSILLARRFIRPSEPFAVSMGDLLSFSEEPLLRQLINVYHRKGHPVLSVQKARQEDMPDIASKNGMIFVQKSFGKLHLVGRIAEKPGARLAPSRLFMTGKYVLTPDIFTYLQDVVQSHINSEVKLAEALQHYCQEHDLFALECRGRILDTGNKFDFLKASILLGGAHKEFKKPLKKFLRGENMSL